MSPFDPTAVRFDELGLVVTVAQDVASGTVLMVAYMDEEAIRRTVETGQAHFWSRSRQALWRKGEQSGNVLHVERIQADCDGDALLLSVHAAGPACHTGQRSCFAQPVTVLDQLDETLRDRRQRLPPDSYTASLFVKGRQAILRKIGEEAIEVILAGQGSRTDAVVEEVADLWFHSLVLLADQGVRSGDVLDVLSRRRRPMP